MGRSASAKLAWGIDLGSEENDWHDGKLAPLAERFQSSDDEEDEDEDEDEAPQSFYDWAEKELPALYVDTAARDAAFEVQHAKIDVMIAAGRRAEYVAERQAIADRYAAPVTAESYGYEYGSHALILARTKTWATDFTAEAVDLSTVAQPTAEEIDHLRRAVESLGLTFDPADVRLLLMPQYG